MDRTFNPCDECDYAFHKQNQESGMCKICEFKQLQESQIDAIELCKIKIALDKLKEYQQLEEQGLLLKLPCKVGDTVYVDEKALRKRKEHGAFSEKKIIFESVNRPKYVKCEVVAISWKKKGSYIKVRYTGEFEEKYFDYETGYDYRIITDYIDMNFVFSSIGKTVFLTKEEAEQALEENERR